LLPKELFGTPVWQGTWVPEKLEDGICACCLTRPLTRPRMSRTLVNGPPATRSGRAFEWGKYALGEPAQLPSTGTDHRQPPDVN